MVPVGPEKKLGGSRPRSHPSSMLPIPPTPSPLLTDSPAPSRTWPRASPPRRAPQPAKELCISIKALASKSTADLAPFLLSLLTPVLAAVGDKMTPVKNAAQETALAIVKAVNANAVKAILPHIINSILTPHQKWPRRSPASAVSSPRMSPPHRLALRVPDLLPFVSESMWDTKPEVKKMAYGTMEKICGLIVNKDIERFISELIKCIAKPENVPETVHLLGATTFVI